MKKLVVVLLFLAVSATAQLRTVTTWAGARGMKAAIDGKGSAARFTRPLALATDQGHRRVPWSSPGRALVDQV